MTGSPAEIGGIRLKGGEELYQEIRESLDAGNHVMVRTVPESKVAFYIALRRKQSFTGKRIIEVWDAMTPEERDEATKQLAEAFLGKPSMSQWLAAKVRQVFNGGIAG